MSILLAVVPLGAQEIKFPASFDALAEKAKEVVDITLDSSMLGLAGNFLSGQSGEEAEIKKMIGNLKGVYVRSFEFEEEGQYSPSELDQMRSDLLDSPNWVRIVGVHSAKGSGDNVDIFLKREAGKIAGLALLSAEPKELTVVYIDGMVDPASLSKLGGNFGIPKIDLGGLKEQEKEQ